MAVKTIAFMLPWVDPLSANSNLYNAGVIARIETSIADRAITAGKALEINANIFDQQLNSTDSPTFAGLTVTGTSGNTDLINHFITMDRANANYIQASDASGILILGAGGSGGLYPSVRLNSNGDVVFYDGARTSQKFFWDASASSLGIGTTSPDYTLDVNGTAYAVNFRGPDSGYTVGGDTDNLGAAFQLYPTAGQIRGYINGSQACVLTSTGFGIGTTSPSHTLDVVGEAEIISSRNYTGSTPGSSSYALAAGGSGSGQVGIGQHNALPSLQGFGSGTGYSLHINPAAGNVLIANGGGKVGIGTTLPNSKFEVASGSSVSTFQQTTMDTSALLTTTATAGNGNFGSSLGFSRLDSTTRLGAAIAVVQTSTDSDQTGLAIFGHTSSSTGGSMDEFARFNHNGNFGLGTTGPQTKLHVNGTVRLQNLPTSASGLSAGDLWNDGGTLKIA